MNTSLTESSAFNTGLCVERQSNVRKKKSKEDSNRGSEQGRDKNHYGNITKIGKNKKEATIRKKKRKSTRIQGKNNDYVDKKAKFT